MQYNRSNSREKWTIMKYTSNFHLMMAYAKALREGNKITDENIKSVLKKMEAKGVYNPRSGGSVHTGTFKIIQLAWYMIGYYKKGTRDKKFVFTPLGELLLDNLDNAEDTAKIFLTMLFGNGFKQPFSRMNNEFNIYPFRLIFKLLRDPRLDYKLNDYEMFYFVMFVKEINNEKYELLVEDILKYRQKSSAQLMEKFVEDEAIIVQTLHETQYFFEMCNSANIFKLKSTTNFEKLGTLYQGNSRSPRAFRGRYVELSEFLINYTDILLENYSYIGKPYNEEELEVSFDTDIMLDMYNFYPPELLEELGIEDDIQRELSYLITIINDVEKLSTNDEKGDHNKFEIALEEAFNIFIDVRAQRISGAGRTDIECIYYPESKQDKKFNIEAKSRRVKLEEVNAGRLAHHRDISKAKYTLVVSSDFTFSIKYDIKSQDIVTIKAATLSNYLYNFVIKKGRHISYEYLDNLIINNLGKDITNQVQEYIYSNFSHAVTE